MSNFHFLKCMQNTCKNSFGMNPFCMRFETHCGYNLIKYNVLKTAFLWAIFTSVNTWKTRAKTVLKLMNFAYVLKQFCEDKFEKHVQKNAFSWAFFTLVNASKTPAKNCVFVSNFHFGKCLQNTSKNHFQINDFCMCFWNTLWRQVWKTLVKNCGFVSNFHFGKCLQYKGKTVLK